jgi:16S rRNA (cytosine1402-N4)-methyltransferase
MSQKFSHISVMPKEALSFFINKDNQVWVDATAGGGGHLALLVEHMGANSQILAFDRDKRAHELDAAGGVQAQFPKQIKLFLKPFSTIKEIVQEQGIDKIDGLICDLGVSSEQLSKRDRGFSFLEDGPIDMRMDQSFGISAYEWLEKISEKELADTLYTLGDERKSRQIASLIKKRWPLENSTKALANLMLQAIRPKKYSKIHPATRSFQAIRMAVNDEVGELKKLLYDLPDLLNIDGVAVFISFHSIEDRLVKEAFKSFVKDYPNKFIILTKKPLFPNEDELNINKRARSAKLRAIKRIS